jgi:hypothetical protein
LGAPSVVGQTLVNIYAGSGGVYFEFTSAHDAITAVTVPAVVAAESVRLQITLVDCELKQVNKEENPFTYSAFVGISQLVPDSNTVGNRNNIGRSVRVHVKGKTDIGTSQDLLRFKGTSFGT